MREGIRIMGGYLRRFRGAVIVAAVLAVIQAIADGVVPFLTGRLFDAILDTETVFTIAGIEMAAWVVYFIGFAMALLVAGGVGWIVDRMRREIGTDMAAYYPAQAISKLLRLPVAFFKAERIGEVTERVQRARQSLVNIIEELAIGIAPQLLSVLIGITIAFFIHPLLASILVIGVAAYIVTLIRIVPPLIPLQKERNKQWRESWGMGMDAISNYHAVKQATAEQYEASRINKKFTKDAASIQKRVERIWSGITFYQRILIIITQLLLIGLAIYFIRAGELSIGDLIALNGYAGMLFGPFVRLGFQWQTVQDGLVNIGAAEEMLSLEPERTYGSGKKLAHVNGEVSFEQVQFAYPDEPNVPVLHDLTFTAETGDSIALVGESGVGKSTVIELLSGYYYPTAGAVVIDGNDTRDIDLASLRQHVAVVTQEPVLFNDTIEANIAYGSFKASRKDIAEAAKKAHADVFIEKFPNKYDQLVGERGIKLSVGQKQRVAIARAFLRQPSILILDEPTSALDARTEQYITEALEILMKGRTTFIIAHRLSTVRKADTILVFDKGQIVERGTHEELLKKNGVYRRLHDYQIGLH